MALRTRVGIVGCLWAVTAPVFAQVSERWSTNFPPPVTGFADAYYPTSLVVDAAGVGYLACQASTQSGTVAGMAVVRFDADGSVPWSRVFAGGHSVYGLALSPFDGGIYESGSMPAGRVQVVKYDAAGNLLWATPLYMGPLGFSGAAHAGKGLAFDAAGNVYVCGTTRTGPNFSTDNDAFVISYEPGGAFRFETLIPGAANLADAAKFIVADGTGGVLVAGTADGQSTELGASTFLARLSSGGALLGFTTDDSPVGTQKRSVALVLDSLGNALTMRHSGPTSGSWTETRISRYDAALQPNGVLTYSAAALRATGFGVDATGGVGVVGYLPINNNPAFVARFDAALNPLWQKLVSVASASSHFLHHVAFGSNGDVTAAGFIATPNSGYQDSESVVYRYDAAGNLRWSHAYGAGDLQGNNIVSQHIDEFGLTRVAISASDIAGGFSPPRLVFKALEPQSHTFCHGDGILAACPCGNVSGPLEQRGCANSIGAAAQLVDAGGASVTSDTLSLTCSGMDSTAIALVVEGSSPIQPLAFGDGLRCFGGALLRLYLRAASGGSVTVPAIGDLTLSAQSTALGGTITAGSQRVYQVYYRDSSLTFCPNPSGGTFNFSNGLFVTWNP